MKFEKELTAKQREGLDWVVAQRNAEIKLRNTEKTDAHTSRVKAINDANAALPKGEPKQEIPSAPTPEPNVVALDYVDARIDEVLASYYRQMVEAKADASWDAEVKGKL